MPNKIDVTRCASGFNALFAPFIPEGQSLVLFLDEDNHAEVEAHNVLRQSSVQNNDIVNIQRSINDMQEQIDAIDLSAGVSQDSSDDEVYVYVSGNMGINGNYDLCITPVATLGPFTNEIFNSYWLYEGEKVYDDTRVLNIIDILGEMLASSIRRIYLVKKDGTYAQMSSE